METGEVVRAFTNIIKPEKSRYYFIAESDFLSIILPFWRMATVFGKGWKCLA
jgi:hypothetical protein